MVILVMQLILFAVGNISEKKKNLLKITEESLYKGIEKAIDGNTINDISVQFRIMLKVRDFGV